MGSLICAPSTSARPLATGQPQEATGIRLTEAEDGSEATAKKNIITMIDAVVATCLGIADTTNGTGILTDRLQWLTRGVFPPLWAPKVPSKIVGLGWIWRVQSYLMPCMECLGLRCCPVLGMGVTTGGGNRERWLVAWEFCKPSMLGFQPCECQE